MRLNNIKKMQSERGFTLVELLIVIVIIAILAAITIVAYNGITSRAHKAAGQQAAQNVVNKSEAFNAENGYYPPVMGNLTNTPTTITPTTSSSSSWYLPTNAIAGGVSTTPTASNPDNAVSFSTCPTGATGTAATGTKVGYWDPTLSTPAIVYMYAGTSTGC